MKKHLDSKCPISFGAPSQGFDKVISASKPERYDGAGRPSARGPLQRVTGTLMSGLLLIGLLAIAVFAAPSTSQAASISIGISVGIAPPPIPVYAQPVCPAPGYMWTPGYWAYDPVGGFYWVPGTWVMAPAPGLLWTPGYWGWGGSAFIFHAGYWGPRVGFYGGINYGYGYMGVGFVGGEWRGGVFFYNRSMNNFGTMHFTNVYYRPVVSNFAVNRVSYNGGVGGLSARPTPGELAAEHDRHIDATSIQRQHEMAARADRAQFASVNHGRPGVAATARPGEFRGAGVVQASRAGGVVNPGGYHGTNPSHTTGYSGVRTPNPGGGGTHTFATAHPNNPSSHSSGPWQEGKNHSTSSHPGGSGGSGPTHQALAHQEQPQKHGSRPSGGGKNEPHEDESHR